MVALRLIDDLEGRFDASDTVLVSIAFFWEGKGKQKGMACTIVLILFKKFSQVFLLFSRTFLKGHYFIFDDIESPIEG